MLKIAVSGKMAAGKTTLTNLIQQHHELQQPITSDGYFNGAFTTSERLSVAAPVKEVAKNYFLMPEDYKDRPLLQQIGQKFREIRPSVWIDLMVHKSRTLTQQYKSNKTEGCLVCDDVRFPNEVDALKADGWFVIRLDTDENERFKRITNTYTNAEIHWSNRNEISETALDNYEGNWDLVLSNPSIEDLKSEISEFYARLSHSPQA